MHLVVLMVFASPVIATVYGGLTLIVCNLISSWLGWPELSLPWWPQRPGRAGGDNILVYRRRVVGCLHRSYSVGRVLRATLICSPPAARRPSKKVPWRHVKNFRQAFERSKCGLRRPLSKWLR